MSALRDRDRASIRAWVQAHSDDLSGRVLDFGSGKQPYRDIIEAAGGEYWPYDSMDFPGSCAEVNTAQLPDEDEGIFDGCICNQVLQYVPYPGETLEFVRYLLRPGGLLVMTGPTNWPIVEKEDLWRFTPAGVETLLARAGFARYGAAQREVFVAEGDARWPIGWMAWARA